MRHVYFQILGNRQLVDPIFNNLIKVAMENATFWENMQALEHSASTIEGNYQAFVSAASRFNNNNFTYQYPAEYHAEIPAEIPEQRHVERHFQRPTARHCNHRSRNRREPNNNNRSPGYEHHYAFMALTVDPSTDAPGDDDESVHPTREPVQTPGTSNKFFATDTEEELYEENKKLHTVLKKLDNFLRVQHPELLRTMQKMSLFDETASDPDVEPGSSHPTSTRTANTTARNASGTPLYKTAYINLNDDLRAESERKPAGRREEQREGDSSLRTDTSTGAGLTKEGPATGDGEILKNKGDPAKFQKATTFLKFPSGNQPDADNVDNISNSEAEKRAILQLSDEDSRKLLLLASALENVGSNKKMSECKLQKRLFDSAKQLKLKEFKYDSNPSVRRRLFQSFYNQLVSVLSSVESFEGVLLDDYEVHPFADPNGAPNKALFRLLLTYVDTHFKTILRRKETMGSVTKPFWLYRRSVLV